MRYIASLNKYKGLFFFGVYLLAETSADWLESEISSLRKYDLALHTGIFAAAIVFLVFMQRRINRSEAALEQNRTELQTIFDTLDVAIWSHDMTTDTLYVTPGIEKLYGRSQEEFARNKALWKEVILPEDLPLIEERFNRTTKGETVTTEYRILRPDGEVRWIQDRGVPTFDAKGNMVYFVSVLFDITDRAETEDRYRSLVETSPDLIAVMSRGRIDYMNMAGSRLIGSSCPEALKSSPIEQVFPAQVLQELRLYEETAESDKPSERRLEFQIVGPDGKTLEVEMSAMPILFEGRVARQVVGRDITERKRSEQQIQYMAYYDSLTGLPNRYMIRRRMKEALDERGHQPAAVLFLDLDRFKIINDTQGHTIGDAILQQAAKKLEKAVDRAGMVSRQGGDEFILFLENADGKKAAQVASRVLAEFAEPIMVERREYFITPSVGISLYHADGADEDTLIKLADTAMYHAKERGRNNFQFYDPSLLGVSARKMELEHDLRKAMELEQMAIFYQPQIDLETREIIGVEALIRWEHPTAGRRSPGEFIPLAEETGLIVPLGKWVLQSACRQNKAWQDAGLPPVPVSVNISVRQMEEDRFVDTVMEVLGETGLAPRYLKLEITESIMQNIERSVYILNRLKGLGIKVAIDDFGMGYSSLSYLKHLPIDTLKIDKSFVDDIDSDAGQGAMVKTIIDMGAHLNCAVIAEGIEKREQAEFLIRNGCRIGQGYWFSEPVPAQLVPELFGRKQPA